MSEILSVLKLTDEQKKKLSDTAKKYNFEIIFSDKDVSAEVVKSVDIIIGNANPDLVKQNKNLKWLQTNSAGTDQYVVPDVLPDGCMLTNATGAYSPSVGEHMLAVTLMLMKNLHLYRDNQTNSLWKDEGPVTTLEGSVVLICGAGDIGLHYAKLVKMLGAYTIGVKRRPSEKSEWLDELHLTSDVDKLLPWADVVASVLPGTPATTNFFNKERFGLMKKNALFINAGRGNAVNQEDLEKALTTGVIAGASIDVTTPEPLPKESPLWQIKNLILTPHISGGFHLPVTMNRIVDIACENIKRFFEINCVTTNSSANEKMLNEVDFLTGYKK